jgi:hypothetical protein
MSQLWKTLQEEIFVPEALRERRRRNYHMYGIYVVEYYASQFHFPVTTETMYCVLSLSVTLDEV